MKTAQDPRHLRRQKIVQELFAWEVQRKIKNEGEKTKKIIEFIEKIDKIILESAPEWAIDKINQIDLAILRLAAYEIVFEQSEPTKVVIDEAVELAKEFGNESSPAFINGALGKTLTTKTFLHRLICEKFGVEENQLHANTKLKEELNATDLEISDLLTAIESKLGLSFGKSAIELTTVSDIEEYVEDQL